MAQMSMSDKELSSHFVTSVLLSVLATFLLLIAVSALWFNQYIFNRANFTKIATTSILSDSSREAIASEVTDRLFQKRPALKQLIDDQVIKIISGVLETPRIESLLTRTIARMQTTITSEHPQDTVIDLTGVKVTLAAVAAIGGRLQGDENQEQRIDPKDIPNQIVLIDASRLPNIYDIGIVVSWLGPLAFFAAVISLIYPLYKSFGNKLVLSKTLTVEGICLLVGSVIGYIVGPLFRPALLAKVASSNMRVVIENLYNAFLQAFNQELKYMLLLGLVLCIVALLVWFFAKDNKSYLPVKK